MFKPSKQQKDFFNWITTGNGSCVLEAVAGSGKTSSLVEGLKQMKGSIFFGAFNKKIVVEIQERVPKSMTNLTIGTMHSIGLSIWKRNNPKVQVDAAKCRNLYKKFISEDHAAFEGSVLSLVSYAKQAAVGVLNNLEDSSVWSDLIDHFGVEVYEEEELIIDIAKTIYRKSLATDHEVVDFDDMILAPIIHNCKSPEFSWVLIDESQDLSQARRLLAVKLMDKNGRLVAVGDRHQSIYSFTGADIDSLDILGDMVNAKRLPLSVSFRCPQSVIAEAQKYVSHIEAHESAPVGSVSVLAKDKNIVTEAKAGDAILCRFNAPIIRLVYKFIAEGIPAKIEGREIGTALKTLAKRWKVRSFSTFLDKLDDYREKEGMKLRLKQKESAAVALEDKVDCLKVLVDRVERIDPNAKDPIFRLCQEIDNIFADNISGKFVILSSIHRSKGREFDNVYWLQTGENKRAKKDWEKIAEVNLCYVAITRAKQRLIYFSEK